MERKKLKLDFEMQISDIVDLNKSFAAAKCLVAYCGRNRNHSDIGKNKFIDALPSIKNIPVVGRYDAENDDFGSHDIKVVRNKDDEIDIVNATTPFGLVPESAKQWFETQIVDGEEKDCLFTDIILWKRQHGYEHIINTGRLSESMEIDVSEYVIDQDGYCIIDKFEFEALCLLGSSTEPCFENACVQMYSKEMVSDFKLQFSEMLKEFKTLNQSSTEEPEEVEIENDNDGGKQMTDELKKEVVEEVSKEVTVEELVEVNEEVVENTENVEEPVVDEGTEEPVEEVENTTEEVVEEPVVEETPVKDDFESRYEELKTEYESLEQEFSDYKAEHSFLNSEVEVLKEFKAEKEADERKFAEENLFAKYEDRIGETIDFAELKEKASEYELDALEKECLCIVGKYALVHEKENKQQPESLKFSIETREKEDPIEAIYKKYLNK